MVHYIALIHKDAESCYGVSFPDLPGVTAAADTLDDALNEAGAALAFAAEDWRELTGSELPAPRTLEALRTDAQFNEDAQDGVVAAVPLIRQLAAAV